MNHLSRRNDPFSGISSLHSQLDDMFNSFFGSVPGLNANPAMDIYTEDDKRLVTEIQAPGFSVGDIDISVHDGVLEIKGEKQEKVEEGEKGKRNYMMRESQASFYRRIALPRHADAENIDASFDNGLLKVTVPFKELPQPKKIAIGSGKKK